MSTKIILLLCVFVYHRATATSRPTCEYNNQNYNPGPIPTEDPCVTCECPKYGGKPDCYSQFCNTCDEYEDPVYVPGQCCPECEPKPTTTPLSTESYPSAPECEYNGKKYQPGPIPTNDLCETCWCPPDGGYPECEWQCCDGCTEDEDYVNIPGQCCWECRPRPTTPSPTPFRGCLYNGKPYEPGPIPTNNPCETCYCPPEGGEPECEWQCCMECTEDEDRVVSPGQCCEECRPKPTTTPLSTESYPSAPECEYNGKKYQPGPIPTNDLCETCYCPPDGGDPECELQCCDGCTEDEDYVYIPDQCCWECRPRGCLYNGKPYEVGPIPTNDPCETCWCPPGGGEPECEWQGCMSCNEDEDRVDSPGQCCAECRPRPPPECQYNGQPYPVGPIPTNDPCLECECSDNGETECSSYGCAGCDYHYDEVYTPGKCCPDCRPRQTPAPGCYYNGTTYKPGPVPSTDHCEVCECPDGGGDLVCYREPCRSCPGWADDYTRPGQCCPTCENEPKP